MRNEITIGVIIGLLWGSGLLAPGAVFNTPEAAPEMQLAPQEPAYQPQPLDEAKPLSHYKAINERDLFRPAVLPHTPPRRPKQTTSLPAFPKPVWRSPLQGWVYAGYAAIDGVAVAILQDPSSAQAVFLHEGESFRGGDVESITPDSVRVTFEGKIESVAKSQEYNTVPLDSSSTSAAAAPETRQPNRAAANRPATVRPAVTRPLQPAAAPPTAAATQRMTAVGAPGPRPTQLRTEWESRRRRLLRRGNNTSPVTDTITPGEEIFPDASELEQESDESEPEDDNL